MSFKSRLKKAYKATDRFVAGGALPGGAPKSAVSPVTKVVKNQIVPVTKKLLDPRPAAKAAYRVFDSNVVGGNLPGGAPKSDRAVVTRVYRYVDDTIGGVLPRGAPLTAPATIGGAVGDAAGAGLKGLLGDDWQKVALIGLAVYVLATR